MVEKIEKAIQRLFWVPFVFGFYGYFFLEKIPFWESIYATCALYFVNPTQDVVNPAIQVGQITAVIVAAGVVLTFLQSAYAAIDHFFIRKNEDSTAVYGDNAWSDELAESMEHGYLSEITDGHKIENTKNHIIMFSDDMTNINFYAERKDKLQNSNTYILLNETDSFLLNSGTSKDRVHYFNVYELMARSFWKEHNLYDSIDEAVLKIGIVGYGNIGKSIFKYGYLNNIYSLNQRIEYHIWGVTEADWGFLQQLKLVNEDSIILYEKKAVDSVDIIKTMDRVILTEENNLEMLQRLLHARLDLKIYCYNDGESRFETIFNGSGITTFGDMDEILTSESILKEKLFRQAKLFNYDYSLRYASAHADENYAIKMEEEWDNLDGFKKGSNIARADHYWIEKKLVEDGKAAGEDLWRIEHIRWCRFHYINHWEYAPVRDNAKRHHHLLVPYEELPYEEKAKDGIWDDVLKEEIEKLI